MRGTGLVLTAYQDSLQRAMDIVANNVANVNTTGYKRENVSFDSYLAQPTKDDAFLFAIDSGTYRDEVQGATITTGNPLDLALQGPGYFAVQTAAGTRYTRAGSFQVNSAGEIVTASGEKLLGDGGQPIVLPDDSQDLLIAPDGTVSVMSGTSTASTQVGRVRTMKFANEKGLMPVGNNMFSSNDTPTPDEDSHIVQGALEQSNVQAISEMTHMIQVSRSYEMVVHLLDREHQRQSDAISRLGKVAA